MSAQMTAQMTPIRVLQWGLGAMGAGMARLILGKPGLELVAAVDARPDYVGADLGDVLGIGRRLGVTVTDHPEDVLDAASVDCVTIATTSWAAQQRPDLRRILGAGINVVTIAEEMAEPAAQNPQLSDELDALAREHGVSVVGVGVNPGLVLDLLVVALTAGSHTVERIEASRVNDLSPYGPTVMASQRVGMSVEAFRAGVADGTIVGHVGFPESIALISDALGLGIDRIEQTHVSSTAFEASGHGWWVNGNCPTSTAVVTVQLQEYYSDGSWRNKGVVGRSTVRSGGGAGNRATGRAGCNNSSVVSWRSVIDVDLVGVADSPEKLTTPTRNIACLRL